MYIVEKVLILKWFFRLVCGCGCGHDFDDFPRFNSIGKCVNRSKFVSSRILCTFCLTLFFTLNIWKCWKNLKKERVKTSKSNNIWWENRRSRKYEYCIIMLLFKTFKKKKNIFKQVSQYLNNYDAINCIGVKLVKVVCSCKTMSSYIVNTFQ